MSDTIEKQVDSVPLGDRVLVKIEKKEIVKNGLIIPEINQKLSQEGVVVAIGDGWDNGKYKKAEVKVGDRVIFGKYSGTEVKLDGQDYIIMGFHSVEGVIESEEAA